MDPLVLGSGQGSTDPFPTQLGICHQIFTPEIYSIFTQQFLETKPGKKPGPWSIHGPIVDGGLTK